MRVLVTGSAGHLGKALVRTLQNTNLLEIWEMKIWCT